MILNLNNPIEASEPAADNSSLLGLMSSLAKPDDLGRGGKDFASQLNALLFSDESKINLEDLPELPEGFDLKSFESFIGNQDLEIDDSQDVLPQVSSWLADQGLAADLSSVKKESPAVKDFTLKDLKDSLPDLSLARSADESGFSLLEKSVGQDLSELAEDIELKEIDVTKVEAVNIADAEETEDAVDDSLGDSLDKSVRVGVLAQQDRDSAEAESAEEGLPDEVLAELAGFNKTEEISELDAKVGDKASDKVEADLESVDLEASGKTLEQTLSEKNTDNIVDEKVDRKLSADEELDESLEDDKPVKSENISVLPADIETEDIEALEGEKTSNEYAADFSKVALDDEVKSQDLKVEQSEQQQELNFNNDINYQNVASSDERRAESQVQSQNQGQGGATSNTSSTASFSSSGQQAFGEQQKQSLFQQLSQQMAQKQVSSNLERAVREAVSSASLASEAIGSAAEARIDDSSEGGKRSPSLPNLASINYPLRSPNWSNSVGKRLVFMVNNNLPQAQITLNPDDLGPIKIRLQADRDGGLSVAMTAHHSMTREALEQAIPRLREMLTESGIKFGDLDVQDESEFNHAQDQQQNQKRGSKVAGAANEDNAEPSKIIETDNLIDYYA